MVQSRITSRKKQRHLGGGGASQTQTTVNKTQQCKQSIEQQ